MTPLLAVLLSLSPVVRAETYELDPTTGSFHVVLRKEGLLKGLGHDHVVEVRDFAGRVELWTSSGAVSLEISTEKLEIDGAQARHEEGIKAEVGPGDHAKILSGMRGKKGLDVARFPAVTYRSTHVEPVEGEKGMWMVSGFFGLHGMGSEMDLPVTLTERPGGYWISGYVRIRPSDYGIKPFSVMGGLIAVQDEAMVRFNLAAVKR